MGNGIIVGPRVLGSDGGIGSASRVNSAAEVANVVDVSSEEVDAVVNVSLGGRSGDQTMRAIYGTVVFGLAFTGVTEDLLEAEAILGLTDDFFNDTSEDVDDVGANSGDVEGTGVSVGSAGKNQGLEGLAVTIVN